MSTEVNIPSLAAENDPRFYITEAVTYYLCMLENRKNIAGGNPTRISRLLSTLTTFRKRHLSPSEIFNPFLKEWKRFPQIRSDRSDQIASIASGIMTDNTPSEDLVTKANRAALAVKHPELAKFAAIVVHIGLKKSDLVIDEISSEAAKKILFSPVKVSKIIDSMARLNTPVKKAMLKTIHSQSSLAPTPAT